MEQQMQKNHDDKTCEHCGENKDSCNCDGHGHEQGGHVCACGGGCGCSH